MPRGVRKEKTNDERKVELQSGIELIQARMKKDSEKLLDLERQLKEIERTELISRLWQVADKEGKSVDELLKPIIGS